MAEYAIERIDAAYADLQALLPAQWAHTGDSDIACNPNWPVYKTLEERGNLLLVMARDDGRPVGYMVALLTAHPNAVQVLTAEIKTYFVEAGRAVVLNSMADYMMGELARRGVYKIKIWTSAAHPATRLWERKGFELTDIGLTLRLNRAERCNA